MVSRRQKAGDSIKLEEVRLGEFINFPETVHGRSIISFKIPVQKMQLAVIEAMFYMNGHKEPRLLSPSTLPKETKGVMGFEIGIADGIFFDNLDEETARGATEYFSLKSGYRILDFLVVTTYRYSREGRVLPLKFDHHLLRFFFNSGKIEVLLHHLQGTRRLPLDELLKIIFDELRRIVRRESLGKMKVESTRTF